MKLCTQCKKCKPTTRWRLRVTLDMLTDVRYGEIGFDLYPGIVIERRLCHECLITFKEMINIFTNRVETIE